MIILEDRRHRVDMLQVFKIVTEKDIVNKDTWFQWRQRASRTRQSAGLINLMEPRTRLR